MAELGEPGDAKGRLPAGGVTLPGRPGSVEELEQVAPLADLVGEVCCGRNHVHDIKLCPPDDDNADAPLVS